MLKDKTTTEMAGRLVEIATGERGGDGFIVTDVIIGYADGSDDDAVIVLGDWNPKRFPREGDAPLTKAETIGPRLARALDRVGAECEWLDEWARCDECYRAIRIEPNSYFWRPAYAWQNECERVCAACLLADVAGAIDAGGYVNNADNAVTWCDGPELSAAGWTQWESHRPHTYESGWFDGQTDDPREIFEEIRRETAADVVFLLDESSQFYIKFSVWTRDDDREDEDESATDED